MYMDYMLTLQMLTWDAIPGRAYVRSEPNFKLIFFLFSKLLLVVLGPVSVDELVSVENAPFAPLRSALGFT